MRMNLWLVSFDLENYQFLVNAPNIDVAIKKAISANKEMNGFSDWSPAEAENPGNYKVDSVDMRKLNDIIDRLTHLGRYDDVLSFDGYYGF